MNNFRDILGHRSVIENLQGSVKEGRINHAYIFDGAFGSGKRTIAKAFAKMLDCEEGGIDSCNHCLSCRTFDEGNNPDVVYITHEKKQITVDEIRKQIVDDLVFAPYKHKYKIYIMPDADKMNINAQNALLKSLEEPPEYAIIILLCENSNMLIQTILSRCVMIKLHPIDNSLIEKYLLDNSLADENSARLYSRYSMGSIGKAVQLCTSEGFNELREAARSIIEAIEKANIITLYDILETIKSFKGVKNEKESKSRIDELLEIMYLIYHDALVFKVTGDKKYLVDSQSLSTAESLAQGSSHARLIRCCEAVQETRTRLMQNGNTDLMLEAMLFMIKEK